MSVGLTNRSVDSTPFLRETSTSTGKKLTKFSYRYPETLWIKIGIRITSLKINETDFTAG